MNLETSPSSPDFSPASVSSALLTPTDLSPPRSFDLKLNTSYEVGSSHPYLNQSSLLFESSSPGRKQDHLESHLPSFRTGPSHTQMAHAMTSPFPYFEPFSEPPTPTLATAAAQTHYYAPASNSNSHTTYSPPLRRRGEFTRPPPMDWRLTQQLQQQPSSIHPDWRLVNEKLEYNLTAEEPPRSSFVYQQQSPSQLFQASHEVIPISSLD